MSIWQRIKGGWKTYGPNALIGNGAFSTDDDSPFGSVSLADALNLSAYVACLNRRCETIGSLPLHLRDGEKNLLKDHDLYSVLHESPNAMQTAEEFWSLQTANVDIHGNSCSIIERRTRDNSVISLEPIFDTEMVTLHQRKSGAWYYRVGKEEYEPNRILHLKGMSVDGFWGLSRLAMGRQILQAQLTANDFAMRQFKNGTKIGGFFEMDRDPNDGKVKEFQERMEKYSRAENSGKWMMLLKGMKPIGGAEFRAKAIDAELLNSRMFGIEEICRLCNVPPQLIGHSDKASSWASSLEHINLFFLMYSLQPTFVRFEGRIRKSLLTSRDKTLGLEPKFAIQGLLRGDLKARQAFYASALQNGYYNVDEVRDLEERAKIPGGNVYRVQTNMAALDSDATQQKESQA